MNAEIRKMMAEMGLKSPAAVQSRLKHLQLKQAKTGTQRTLTT